MCTGHLFGGHAAIVMLQELEGLFKQLVLGTVLFSGKEDSNDTQFVKIGSPIMFSSYTSKLKAHLQNFSMYKNVISHS